MRGNRQTVLLIGMIAIAAILLRSGGGTPASAPQPVASAVPLAERLEARDRVAKLVVLGQKSDGKGGVVNECLFAELSADGSRYVGVREFKINGNWVEIDGRVAEDGDQRVMLFVLALGEDGRKIELETPDTAPDFYSSGLVAVEAQEAKFWRGMWAEQGKSVLSAKVKLPLSAGAVYGLQLMPDGTMRAQRFLSNAEDEEMLHNGVHVW